MVNIFLNSYNTPGDLFQNFTHELLHQGTYGLLAEFPMGKKKWATVGHGFGLISRDNCAREYGS